MFTKVNVRIFFKYSPPMRDVSYNTGRKITGIDKVTLDSPDARLSIFTVISSNGYMIKESRPSRGFFIHEPDKDRSTSVSIVYVRVIQAMLKSALEPERKAAFEKSSYGFRPQRNVDDLVKRVWGGLNTSDSKQ